MESSPSTRACVCSQCPILLAHIIFVFILGSVLSQLNLSANILGSEGAAALAPAIAVCASITSLSLGDNDLCAEGEAVVRKAVEGRSGFELKL